MNLIAFLYERFPDKDYTSLVSSSHIVYYTHEDFEKAYTFEDFDFVYDAATGLYFREVIIKHVSLMAELYKFHVGSDSNDIYFLADQYILEGHGMFKSKAGPKIYHSKNFKIPPVQSIKRDLEVL